MKQTGVMPRFVFRCDATVEIGIGHVMRCLTLAEEAAVRGYAVRFVCAAETVHVAPALARSGFEVRPTAAGGAIAPADFLEQSAAGLAVLVLDGDVFDAAFERPYRPMVDRLLVLDDLANRPHACDFLLNAAPAVSAESYALHVSADVRLLLGPRYALVHRSFLASREASLARRIIARSAHKILVAFGGTDPANGTSLALAALAGLPGIAVDVALGAAAPHLAEVAESTAALGGTLHVDAANMPALVAAADVAIGAGGSSAWERCALGLPSIIVTIAENQRGIAHAAAAAGAAIDLGDHAGVEVASLRERVVRLLADPAGRAAMSERAATLIDGAGASHVLEEIVGQ